MPPEAKSGYWLQFAKDDLKAARVVARESLYHFACFHSQQAAEKALKAYLIACQNSTPREHHLVALLHHCVREGLKGRSLSHACKILDQYYLPTRYPDAVVGSLPQGLPSRDHASEAIHLAEGVFRSVQKQISQI